MQKQKMLALVVNRMQNGAKIQMGPFSELNYETAKRVSHKCVALELELYQPRKSIISHELISS